MIPGARRFLLANHQGSIVAVTDHTGTLLAANSYDEYGMQGCGECNDIPTRGRFRYTGQAWLAELGLYYYKARVYSPRLGRFLQVDPIGYEDQFNLYAYVGNDPVNAVDFSGKEAGSCYGPSLCGTTQISAEDQATQSAIVGGMAVVAAVGFDLINTPVSPGPDATIVVTASREAVAAARRPGFFTRLWRTITGRGNERTVTVSRSRSPASARHLEESGATGRRLTVDRAGRAQRRRDNMRGTQTRRGTDRDESPPAVFRESEGASVRNIPSSGNKSSGAQIGNQIRDLSDGACVKIEICP